MLAGTNSGHLESTTGRSQFFPSEFFAEPAWDILLDLYAADVGQYRTRSAISALAQIFQQPLRFGGSKYLRSAAYYSGAATPGMGGEFSPNSRTRVEERWTLYSSRFHLQNWCLARLIGEGFDLVAQSVDRQVQMDPRIRRLVAIV